MTEVENLKAKLFELVECVGTLETKPNKDVVTFTKEQLLSYSKFLIDEAVSSIQTGIKCGIDEELLNEAIELELNYDRKIDISVDEYAIRRQVMSMVEESIDEDVEESVNSALKHVFPSIQD